MTFPPKPKAFSQPTIATAELPWLVDRRRGAQLVSETYFRTSHRTLETWPLTWRHVNGRALCELAELFSVAEAKIAAAAPIRGGRLARSPSRKIDQKT